MVYRANQAGPYSSKKKSVKKAPKASSNAWQQFTYGPGAVISQLQQLAGIGSQPSSDQSDPSLNQNQGLTSFGMSPGGLGGLPPFNTEPQTTIQAKKPLTPEQQREAVLQQIITDEASQSFDYDSALQQTAAAIKQQYGAEIGAIRSNNRAAKKQTAKGTTALKQMYAGLAKSYGNAATAQNKQGKRDAAAATKLSADAAATENKSQQESIDYTANTLKGLGLQEAAPAILPGQIQKLADNTKSNTKQGVANAKTATQFSNQTRDFLTRGGQSSKLEGTNRSADLISSLNDYLRQNNQQIPGIAAQRAAALAANKTSTMQAASDAQQKSDSELWDHIIALSNLQNSTQNMKADNKLAQEKFQYQTQQKSGITQYEPKAIQNAMGILKTAKNPQKATNVFQSLSSSDAFRRGKVTTNLGHGNTTTDTLTPYEAADMARAAGKKAGLSPSDINLLALAAMASVG